MIANERRRFNSLYLTEPDVIVIISKKVEVYARMDVSWTQPHVSCSTLCHRSEMTVALKISISLTITIDKRELV